MSDEQRRLEAVYDQRERSGRDRQVFGYEGFFHVCRVQERLYETLRLFKKVGLRDLAAIDILDVGCGEGFMLRQFLEWGASRTRVAGIDIRPVAVERARELSPGIAIRLGSAEDLPWEDEAFGLVCQQTVLSSVLEPRRRQRIAAEMSRVLRGQGFVLWYDFFYDNPGNPNVVGLRMSEIRQLFPHFDVTVKRVTLAPPVARRLPQWTLPLSYELLRSVPLIRTHYLALLRKP
jgi:SAM-dependent methyltransferase